MNKYEFMGIIREKLRGLPDAEVADRLMFYGEMIDDLMEEGLSEEEAVARIGTADEVAARIKSEATFEGVLVTEKEEKRKKFRKPREKRPLRALEIVLLVIGFPLWFAVVLGAVGVALTLGIGAVGVAITLAVVGVAVVFSILAVLWGVVITLWALFGALVGCAVGFALAFPILGMLGNGLLGLSMLGGAMVCAGAAILFFFVCKLLTKGVSLLTAVPFRFRRRGRAR